MTPSEFQRFINDKMAQGLPLEQDLPPLAPERAAAVLALFRLWDVDNSGTVEVTELQSVLLDEVATMQLQLSRVQAAETFASFSPDGDEPLTLGQVLLHFAEPPMGQADDASFYALVDPHLERAYSSFESFQLVTGLDDGPPQSPFDEVEGFPVRAALLARKAARGKWG